MPVHAHLRRGLWAGSVLLIALVVSGMAWAWLSALGDRPAADGARGVAVVTLIALALDTIAVVALLALAELGRGTGRQAPRTEESSPLRNDVA